MSETISLTIDGKTISARAGETILQAAARNGVYIPRLCAFKDLSPFGSCRVCTVFVNGRPAADVTLARRAARPADGEAGAARSCSRTGSPPRRR